MNALPEAQVYVAMTPEMATLLATHGSVAPIVQGSLGTPSDKSRGRALVTRIPVGFLLITSFSIDWSKAIQRSLDSDAADYMTYERLADVGSLESYPAMGIWVWWRLVWKFCFWDLRNCYLFEMFTSFMFFAACLYICFNPRACWRSFRKAGFVCMAHCRQVLAHMEANCCMKWTLAPEGLWCYILFLVFGFTFAARCECRF